MRYKIAMGYKLSAYKTKELSEKSWPDFERLFSRGNGWDHCQCMHFHRPCALPKTEWLRSRAERAVRNRGEKRSLSKGAGHTAFSCTRTENLWAGASMAERKNFRASTATETMEAWRPRHRPCRS